MERRVGSGKLQERSVDLPGPRSTRTTRRQQANIQELDRMVSLGSNFLIIGGDLQGSQKDENQHSNLRRLDAFGIDKSESQSQNQTVESKVHAALSENDSSDHMHIL